jgi:hypothetical protein
MEVFFTRVTIRISHSLAFSPSYNIGNLVSQLIMGEHKSQDVIMHRVTLVFMLLSCCLSVHELY